MRIAQVAPPLQQVPPAGYGGTERVISTLTEALVRRGHDVTLFATGDSRSSARLVPTLDQAAWCRKPAYGDVTPLWISVVGRVQRELEDFDVVHSHLEVLGLPLARQSSVPVVSTLHGRMDLPELVPPFSEFSEAPLVSISNAQRKGLPSGNYVATVYHAIEVQRFTFNPHPDSYLAFLGRVSREKGLDRAIRLARRAGRRLRVAARPPLPNKAHPSVRADWEYWENDVQPLLGDDVEMIGEVSGTDKDEFLRNASALLFPIDWPEPFGLVMIEALACGTPVVAMRRGSVPEIIEHGKTGLVGDNEEELARLLNHVGEINRECCRAEAERRFSPDAMASGYEEVYESLSSGGRLEASQRILEAAEIDEDLLRSPAPLTERVRC